MANNCIVVGGCAMALLAVATTPAWGQTAASAAETKKDGGLEDIIVTAQRQVSSVQQTPLAIAAIDGGTLVERGISDLQSLTQGVPNVSFSRMTSDARIFIRGIGLDTIASGVDGRVAVYNDEVVNARPQGTLVSLFDINRVEVLRGPQGTLYGRNATAGAINIISNDPTDTLEGYGTFTAGNYNLIRTEGAISGPLSDTVSARLAFQTNDRDGYGKNISTGNDVDDEHSRAIRAKLRFDPSDTFKATLTGEYRTEDDAQGAFRVVGYSVRPNGTVNIPTDVTLGGELPDDPYDMAGVPDQAYELDTAGFTANLVWTLGDVQITSVTGYRYLDQYSQSSIDGTTTENSELRVWNNSDQYSQELRLNVTAGPVDLVAGVYYFYEENGYSQRAFVSPVYFTLPFGISEPQKPIIEGTSQGGDQETDAYAGFFQLTYHVTDRLGIDIGARYSYEDRSIDQFQQLDAVRVADVDNEPLAATPELCPVPPPTAFQYRCELKQDESWSKFDPRVTLHYEFADGIMGYATYSRGFKSGGFNFGALQAPFEPEELTDYEVGLKADLLDRRLRVNLAGFYYDYTNMQVNVIEDLFLVTRNAAKSELYGVEAEITALPTDNLRLGLNAAWLHSEYKDYEDIPSVQDDPDNPLVVDISGNQLTYAPEYRVAGDIAYTIDAGSLSWTPRAELSWTDKVQYSVYNVPYQVEPSRWELNLFLDLVAQNGWSANAFIRNATDDTYYIAKVVSAELFGWPINGVPAAPRTYGLSVTKRF